MQYDIIAFQLEGRNACVPCTPAGHEFFVQFQPKEEWTFLDYVQSLGLGSDLVIGVMCPDGETMEFDPQLFCDHPLH
jgi:hypothetical protein